MDQIIKERVESGERMLVIVADKQGELQFQGNDQVVEEVTQDQELMDRLKLSFNRPGAEGYGYEYRRFAKFVLPRSAVKIRGKGWASNVVSDYLRVLLKTLCDAGMLKKRFYGKGLAPSWYPADLKWEEFGKVSNKGTQEQKTKICEAKCLKAKCLKRSVTPENKGEGGGSNPNERQKSIRDLHTALEVFP